MEEPIGTSRRVMLIDDDGVCLAMMARSLRRRGYQISSYSDPREALKQLAHDLPEVVVTDMRMPHMSGLQLVREVQERLGEHAPPVLVVSSEDDERALEEAFRLGACDYLLKPVNEAELGVKLVRALKVGSRGEAPRQAAPTIPEKIGPWVLVDCIGRGGTACVFTATRPPSDAQYALKLIWPHLTENTETLLRFRREIDTLSTLLHPGLVRFIESGRHEEFFYYAMSYLPGGTLRARIRRRGPHAPAETLQIVRGIAEPLGYLHDRGLVHRDVKPGNVFFDQDDHVVLGDFGLAKRLLDKGITLSEEFVGTPLYLAPEVFRSDRFDQTVDFYAMGVCAYEMLLGRAVIDEPDSMRLIGRIMNEGLPPPATQLSPEKTDTPAELVGLIARLIDPDPTQRPQNAQEVLDALDALGS